MTLSRRAAVLASMAGLFLPRGSARAQGAGTGWKLPSPSAVRVVENVWIPMNDGVRLSASLWLPELPGDPACPMVLEYIPYRKRDMYRAHDASWGDALAKYGIGYARVDLRGSGESEGVLVDEYLPVELQDGVEIISWLARQEFCNGRVGMRGYSWGGINTLQVAAMGPPALKAILPMCCTDTRYTDDGHYIGGALGLTNFQWAVLFKLVMACPPDPAIVGAHAWRAMWQQRLDAAPDIAATWVSHQHNDAYWRRGSVSADYAAIKCPVFIVDGWTDTYVNTVFRILEHARVPIRALVGPWAHTYPEEGAPGPALRWITEEVRWWLHWLAGANTGIMDEPLLRSFMPSATASQTAGADLPGSWISETAWPSPNITPRILYCSPGKLSAEPGQGSHAYLADKIVGLGKPEWLPFSRQGLPREQSADDRNSVLFDSEMLPADLEILGRVVAHMRVSANRPVAHLALRLCEVDADGKSWLITYGLLNLAQRDSTETPAPLVPGTFYDVRIALSAIAYRFKKGCRIRLALSESLWPLVWPSPEVVTLTFDLQGSSIELPVRTPPQHETPSKMSALTQTGTPMPNEAPPTERGPEPNGVIKISSEAPGGAYVVPGTFTKLTGLGAIGMASTDQTLTVREAYPNDGAWHVASFTGFERGDWKCQVLSSCHLSSTPDTFVVKESLQAIEDGKTVFMRSKVTRIARDLI